MYQAKVQAKLKLFKVCVKFRFNLSPLKNKQIKRGVLLRGDEPSSQPATIHLLLQI